MNKKSVNIIGAGPGGLAAGMLLVKEGFVVNIYEKNSKVGGRNGSIQLGDYIFDIGPTFLMMTESLEKIFSLCNLNLHDYVKIKKLDPMYRLNFADGRELFPSSDSDKMCKQLEKFKPGSSKGYLKYLKKEKKKHDKLLPCLKAPYSGLKDYLRLRLISSLPYLDAHVSVYQVLQRYFKDPDVCTAFTFQAKYIGMSPWTAPGTFSIITFIEYEGGIYHVEGGLNKISAGMAKAFIEMGGKIHFKNEIESIEVEKKQYRSIKIKNKGEFSSDFLFINSDFAYTMSKLVEEKKRPHYTELKLKEKKYSCSTFMLYLGVKKSYPDIAHHSIIFASDYKKNVQEITDSKVLSEDFSVYVQNASITDTTLAPKGKSTIYVLAPVPNNKSGINWKKEKKTFRDKIIHLLETRGKYQDLERNIEEELIVTPQDWEEKYNVYLGATFNLAHSMGQMLHRRPNNKFEEFDNCYLVGGGTHPGSGLPTIYESAKISTSLLLKNLKKTGK